MTNPNLSGIRKNYKGKLCVGENLSLLFRITQGGLEVSFKSLIDNLLSGIARLTNLLPEGIGSPTLLLPRELKLRRPGCSLYR